MHDFDGTDNKCLDRTLSLLEQDPPVSESVLMSNERLATHPLQEASFIRKRMRNVNWDAPWDEFKLAFEEMALDRPHEDWTFPPDLEGFETPEFWGLPTTGPF